MARSEIGYIVQRVNPTTNQITVIPQATVEVRSRADNSLATLYQNETGAVTVPNPVTADSLGRIEAWVDAGKYNLVISGVGIATPYTQPIDMPEGGALVPGPKGDKGDQGLKGDQGNVGPAGPIGATGPVGPTGPAGPGGTNAVIGDAGNITGLTSAGIDALFAPTPLNGALATGLDGTTPILLMRRAGLWHKSAAYTQIA